MNAPDTSHALAPDLVWLAPATFAVRGTANGLSAVEAASGVVLSILLKVSARGVPDANRLFESTMALLQKKHAAESVGVPAAIDIGACRGYCGLLQATTSKGPMQMVLTTLTVPDPMNAAQQRNLIGVLEVPTDVYGQRPAFYQRFLRDRLQIGEVSQGAPVELEMAPLDAPVQPEPPTAHTALPPTPMQAPTAVVAPAVRTVPRVVVTEPSEDELLASAAHGQRTLAISIVLSFVARAIGNVPDVPVMLAYGISAAVLIYAISGVLRICSGFRYSMNRKLVLMFCSSVPLIGIICWVWLSIRTTRRLRNAGYQVGLFGARS